MCIKYPIPLLSLRGMRLYKVLNEDLSSNYNEEILPNFQDVDYNFQGRE